MYIPWIASVSLLISVIPDLPYGYYQLLRWLVCGSSCYGALLAHEKNKQYWKWFFVCQAILFNPILPIHLERNVWLPIDIASSIIFAVSYKLFMQPKTTKII